MKALILDGSVKLVKKYPDPTPAEGEALIRLLYAGICDTDLELAKGYMGFKGVLGHEFVGIVEEAPDKDLIGKNVSYISKLKQFTVEKMLFGKKHAKRLKFPTKYSIGIKKADGTVAVVDIREEKDGVFVAQVREKPGVFRITKDVFASVFEGLDKLNLTKEEKNQ